MSTSVLRNSPPALPASRSRYATFAPPSLKRSTSIVPGTVAGVPPNGVPSPDDDPLTVTVVETTFVPYGPSAINVYIVVADGETDIDPLAPDAPIDGAIVTFVAPLVFHDSVADPPAMIDDGVAVSVPDAAGRGP